MQVVRFAIVIFFLVVVPTAAALDAVAPQFLDAALGRTPRGAVAPPAPWEGDGALSLRAGASELPANLAPPLSPPATETAPPVASDLAASSRNENIPRAARESTNPASPGTESAARLASTSAPPTATITAVRPHEPVFRGVPDESAAAPRREPSPADSQLLAIQNRLGELGATYMRLESTGGSGRMYRFLCQMQISPGKTDVTPFEATAADPLEAMHRVLSDVEAWQAMEITRLRR